MEIEDFGFNGMVRNWRSVVHYSLMREKLIGNQPLRNLKILKQVVHMALLDSGFVPLDPTSVSGESVFYTFPQILHNGGDAIDGIVVVFHCFSPFVEAYRDGYPVGLDEKKYVPALIYFVWGNHRVDSKYNVTVGLLERQVKEIWNVVKNEIVLPLLKDLYCAVTLTSSHAPLCHLLELPTELLAKILKCLPVEDVARVSCVCKELRHLANNDEFDNEFWKQKLGEEYGTSFGDRVEYWIVEEKKSRKSRFSVTSNKEKYSWIRGRLGLWSWKQHDSRRIW